jgi:8-oxo-dGTP pyrophosphatase MutT (NUDIX family)
MGIIGVLLYSQGLLGPTFDIPFWVILSCQAAMGLGTLAGAGASCARWDRESLGCTPVQGFCAEAGGAITLFLVTHFGIPVSTTHTITGAIIGVGAARKTAAVRWNVATDVVLAWVVTLPAAALFGRRLLRDLQASFVMRPAGVTLRRIVALREGARLVRAASMSNSSKTAVVKRVQYGALPYRLRAGSRRPQFMLITSRETRRWVIPKGWPKKGRSPQYSAAREAFEEAGVLGAVAKRSIGSFSYEKRLKNGEVIVCDVRVFPLEVRRQSKQWPEKQERIVKWVSASHAAERVSEPTLGEIIRRLARKYDGREGD